jgi:Short C-terminal domain
MPLVRRRPVLRAAAIGGGAYVAGKRRQESLGREQGQEQRLAELEARQAPPPAPPAAPAQAAPAAGGMAPNVIEQLKELGQLHEQGVLTDEEFAQQKARLLGN